MPLWTNAGNLRPCPSAANVRSLWSQKGHAEIWDQPVILIRHIDRTLTKIEWTLKVSV
ncbi:hypothetical protein SCLCIDRAFT_1218634 [Scleroderma citrinum Foug A]|uniref:Uncharacterized protein n=1 Tax=Scleroderma citrinum Foug A TaxID=1036808 RepID=A0A0C2Z9C3_9AGAM|nr:hypothetical protein SCLCIDRAFT_1218634 [Scleroderma citrinum Foug A]